MIKSMTYIILILLIILYLFDYIDLFYLGNKKQATEVACKVLAWLTHYWYSTVTAVPSATTEPETVLGLVTGADFSMATFQLPDGRL